MPDTGWRMPENSRRERLTSLAWPEPPLNRVVDVAKRDDVFLPDPPRVLARRAADDVRRLRADQPHSFARQLLEPLHVHPFALQHLPLQLAAERVLADTARRGDDAVTRHHERHDVLR